LVLSHEVDSRVCSVSVGLRSQARARSHYTGDYPAVVWTTVDGSPQGFSKIERGESPSIRG